MRQVRQVLPSHTCGSASWSGEAVGMRQMFVTLSLQGLVLLPKHTGKKAAKPVCREKEGEGSFPISCPFDFPIVLRFMHIYDICLGDLHGYLCITLVQCLGSQLRVSCPLGTGVTDSS